ncbi:glutamyl-tRNA synthetase [Octadecabacter temperatus]|uniref:Glutamate--tRNA ligase n=1 Tax=Octadecabacter temperatus TaxID=1458307 RepID=A0A0K0Y5M4_9RHOB|nr:glutamate--tRNA ligase [Octadecabacter temperatus]AKS46215.1 Glutamate--tRNA ligase [Octadecabacter temperatus]SIO09831.1 glutamyl-tRNA synthetase [Octadecabacter temperatus]
MSQARVVTRFAPSPTGALHIGGARTALFNWLYARGRGGKFLLRIEDTDKARSTDENTQAILDGLTWLGLDWDGAPTSQAAAAARHIEVANEMLANGHAYKCFATQDEIQAFREDARTNKTSTLYRSPWRDVADADHPDLPFVVRVKAPRDGATTLNDEVQGAVTWQNEQLDDMILLRSDGSPVYMLAVVVDDHDMGVTHVIRGDDHLANAFRQNLIYDAMGWDKPTLAHIPLIFGPDGKKLSKRHGATGAAEYQALGYPAAGMRNYLTRLGWSHGDDEFFSDAQAREWFDLGGIGKSPARFDTKKLENICGQHIAVSENAALLHELEAFLDATGQNALTSEQHDGILKAMESLKERSKTFPELIDKAHFVLTSRPLEMDEKAAKSLDDVHKGILTELTPQLQTVSWSRDELQGIVATLAEAHDTKLGKLAGPLRAVLAGRAVSPSVFDMMLVLGRDETIARIKDATG